MKLWNLSDALRMMREHEQIDLLLSDVQMALRPDTSFSQIETKGGKAAGIALARIFRRRFATSPIIFCTGSYDSEIRHTVGKIENARPISKRQNAMAVLDEIAVMLEGIRTGARQNVIFELGFFMGLLRRDQCRIIMIYKGGFEIPSDIHGILTIDVSQGFGTAANEIRREFAEWL